MKKILAGVLAAASMLAVSATAFATSNTKAVVKPGEVEYEVAVTAPAVTLNLVMPAKLSAALNPYGAEIKLSATDGEVSTAGIASTAYVVTNKSKDYGVWIDATAITSIETSDKPVDGKPAWGVTATAVADGKKGANLTLMGGSVPADFKDTGSTTKTPVAPLTASKAATKNTKADQGALVLDSTVAADKENGVAAGQTTQKKMLYVPANDGTDDGVAAMAFIGALAKDDTANNKEVVWNDDDAINVQLVLKVTVGPKAIS